MALYRIKQGVLALTAFARPVDFDAAKRHLTPALFALFKQMRRSEQQHSLQVMRTLQKAGHHHPDLMTAALLHDVGKNRAAYHVWDKTLIVLVNLVCPGCVTRWGRGEPHGWRRPFVVKTQHAAWGAEMVRAAGAPERVVELIARSHSGETLAGAPGEDEKDEEDEEDEEDIDRLLAALIAADDAN